MIRAGVIGATGYVGSELVRWLTRHPSVELTTVVSTSQAGRPLSDAVPALLGLVDLVLQPLDPAALAELDVVFLATPHGAAAPIAEQLVDVAQIIDCSADHRHADGWRYGQPEWADSLKGATRLAAPGCFATALTLALAPLVHVLDGPAMVTATTGSTGSGATPKAGTHHPLRAVNLKAYKVLGHQHVPEICTFLGQLGPEPTVHFVPQSGPFDRGIFASVLAQVTTDVRPLFHQAYDDQPLVRFRTGSPELRHVRGTAFADLSVHQQDSVVSVLVAIDNLGKGAASQAVQILNLSRGWPIDLGLRALPTTP